MSDRAPVLPSVDIVLTNHNYGRYLERALESACAQTHPDVTVIAVDDGSTDDSREVLARFGDHVEIVLKERGGQASALNAGLKLCRGEVLLILDADDALKPRAAELVAAAFAADAGLSKVQFPMTIVDGMGRDTGARKPSGHLQAPTGDQRRAELAFPFDLPWLPGGGTGFRTVAVQRVLPIPEDRFPRAGADWYLVHLTALLGEAALLDEACAEYRVHGGNSYELERDELDLGHVRESIVFAAATTRGLEALADELRLERERPILSFSDLANRLVSLKLEPRLHPRPQDRTLALLRAAATATHRRFDVSWPMKVILLSWFAVEAIAPRRLARPLAELFLFPGRRARVNRFFGGLQRKRPDPS